MIGKVWNKIKEKIGDAAEYLFECFLYFLSTKANSDY